MSKDDGQQMTLLYEYVNAPHETKTALALAYTKALEIATEPILTPRTNAALKAFNEIVGYQGDFLKTEAENGRIDNPFAIIKFDDKGAKFSKDKGCMVYTNEGTASHPLLTIKPREAPPHAAT
eukprot:Selendium_serpulae@DN10772_c0_g1_i1.p1